MVVIFKCFCLKGLVEKVVRQASRLTVRSDIREQVRKPATLIADFVAMNTADFRHGQWPGRLFLQSRLTHIFSSGLA